MTDHLLEEIKLLRKEIEFLEYIGDQYIRNNSECHICVKGSHDRIIQLKEKIGLIRKRAELKEMVQRFVNTL